MKFVLKVSSLTVGGIERKHLSLKLQEELFGDFFQSFSRRPSCAPSGVYLLLAHGGQARRRPRRHGRDAHLPGHLAHAAGCQVGGHGDAVEIDAVAVVHVAAALLAELRRRLLLREQAARERDTRQRRCEPTS